MSINRNDESYNAEEIVALRMELYRTRQELEAYENSNQLKEIYKKIITKMMQLVSSRNRNVNEITQNLKLTNEIKIKSNFEFKFAQEEGQNAFIAKCENILKEFAEEQQILNKINCVVPQIKKQNEQMRLELQNLQRQYTKSQEKFGKAQVDSRKIKQLQLELQEKSQAFSKIKITNKQFEAKIQSISKQLQQAHQNIQNLQKQRQIFYKNAKSHQISHERLKQQSQQKQKAISNCQKLLQMISIPNQEYLKHYFRNSGLQFSAETTRKQKNKYSLVFDN